VNKFQALEELAARGIHPPEDWSAKQIKDLLADVSADKAAGGVESGGSDYYNELGWPGASPRG